MYLSAIALIFVAGASLVYGQTAPVLTRSVKGNTLQSREAPKLQIKFDKAFKYAGGQAFVLYGVANAEQHFFVDADKDGNISRLYWVQFEGYLSSNTHTYDYSSSQQKVNIDGLEFYGDTWARETDPTQGRPDSDGNRARAFLLSKGLKTKSQDVIMQRLVHMVDTSNRSELMVIYLEDLSGTGMSAADLNQGGKDNSKWNDIGTQLLGRAQKNMKLAQ